MHMRNHRVAASIVAAVAIAGAALAGCSSSGSTSGSASGPVTLTILEHSNPSTQAAMAVLDKEFEAANPSIKIQLTAVPTNNFAQTQTARISAGSVDLTEGASSGSGTQPNPSYVTGAEPTFVSETQAGDWVNLTNEPFMKDYSPSALAMISTDGKYYAVPSGLDLYTGVFYNKTIFAKYGLSVPTTWDQFQSVVQTLKSHGVNPLVIGGKDVWPAGLPMLGIVQSFYSTSAMRQLNQALWTNQASLTSATSVQVLSRIQQLYADAGTTFPGISEVAATADFTNGQAAMWPDGTWNVPSMESTAPNLQFGYFPLPASNNPADNAVLGGKLDFVFAIPSNAPNKAAALKWLAFYSAKANYTTFTKLSGFIPAEPGITSTAFNNSLSGYMGSGGFTPAWDQIFNPNAKSGTLSTYPWAYPNIAPMGQSTNMTQLATQMEANWTASK
jgi:raffinose/stachyose/melibiose transport system substrate-binding protein